MPLEHRLQKVCLPQSTLTEKKQILVKIGLPPRIAQNFIEEFSQHPELCFRDVIKAAKKWVTKYAQQSSIQIDLKPIKQTGQICKTVAIANIEAYYAAKLGYTPIPLWSQKTTTASIRKAAKARDSAQGEILEFQQWKNIIEDLGFDTEQVEFEQNMNIFIDNIVDNLQQGHLPLISFPVDRTSGLPDPETQEPEETEHAAVITGYNFKTDEFTLAHWGKTYTVDAGTLFYATHKLVDTRHQEFYIRNQAYSSKEKWCKQKYLPATNPAQAALRSIVPQQHSGFKAKLIIVKQPDVQQLMEKRQQIHTTIKAKAKLRSITSEERKAPSPEQQHQAPSPEQQHQAPSPEQQHQAPSPEQQHQAPSPEQQHQALKNRNQKKTHEIEVFLKKASQEEITPEELGQYLNDFIQKNKQTIEDLPEHIKDLVDSQQADFKTACNNMVDLVVKLHKNNDISVKRYLDLLFKTAHLIYHPEKYDAFKAEAKQYQTVADGALAAYILLIAGYAAKIFTLGHKGDAWIKLATQKLHAISINQSINTTINQFPNEAKEEKKPRH